MEHYRNSDFGHLTDREILIIVATEQAVVQGRLEDHGKRLRVLEGFAKTATGAIMVVGMVLGWFKIKAGIQ